MHTLAWVGIWLVITLAASGLYYLIFWFTPMDGHCWNYEDGIKKWTWVIINHVIAILIAWLIWGICYINTHPLK